MAHVPPPRPASPQQLGFTPQPMVAWFRPLELVRAGIKALLSALFGAYADYREMQAALRDQRVVDYTREPVAQEQPVAQDTSQPRAEMWIDYIADVGDGFSPTYTMARLLAEPTLTLARNGQAYPTQRGALLIFGGDQVYPTAERTAYQDRLVGPYRAALPWADEAHAPDLFAIPGNHDWYDGLTSFTRLFCQGRWIGGWKTQQTRSYFALKLPHGWWLWGIDVQLKHDIDQPQLDFFHHVAQAEMAPGSRIILCSAEPSWVYAQTEGEQAYTSFAYFQQQCIFPYKHTVHIGLSGDLHAYARYQEEHGTAQRFVAGGGGAYLYPTHDLPERLSLPDVPDGQAQVTYTRRQVFPEEATSRQLALGALLFPVKSWRFSLLIAGLYLLYAWVWQSVSVLQWSMDASLLEQLGSLSPSGGGTLNDVVALLLVIVAHSPGSAVLLLLLAVGLISFADSRVRWHKILLGLTHAMAHVLLALGLMWLFALFNLTVCKLPLEHPLQVLLFVVEMLLGGGLAGGALMGLYLWGSNRLWRLHANEVFSCQSLPDYKHWLRLHLDRDGGLTIYPIGVQKVVRTQRFGGRGGWQLQPQAQPGAPWIEPPGQSLVHTAQLIEDPIRVPGQAQHTV